MRAIGIDIGGSKTLIGLIEASTGKIIKCIEFITPSHHESDHCFLSRLVEATHDLSGSAQLPIGVGICELVEATGDIVSAHRVSLTSDAVRSAFSFAHIIVIDADVRAAALGEAVHGSGRGLKHWIYANAGTGIGTVLMQGDRPYLGSRGRTLAAGMSPIAFVSETAAGAIIEDFAAGAGMLQRARSIGLDFSRVSDLIAAAASGSAAARNVLDTGGAVMGRALGFLANALDPEAIVLGGGVAIGDMGYARACESALHETIWHPDSTLPPVLPAGLGRNSGLVGAALAAIQQPVPRMAI